MLSVASVVFVQAVRPTYVAPKQGDAILAVVKALDHRWKITGFELLEEERLVELKELMKMYEKRAADLDEEIKSARAEFSQLAVEYEKHQADAGRMSEELGQNLADARAEASAAKDHTDELEAAQTDRDKQLNEAPRPPSELVDDLPLWAEGLILKAMLKNPDERYQSMSEFAEALNDEPGEDAKPGAVAKGSKDDANANKWSKKAPAQAAKAGGVSLVVWLIGFALLAVIGGLAFAVFNK